MASASISFTMETQQGLSLCWAAISVSVDKFLTPPSSGLEQLSLAEAVFKLAPGTCFPAPSSGLPRACDKEAGLTEGLGEVGRPVFTPFKPHPSIFADIIKALQANQPVVIGITFLDRDSGHAAVIDACRTVNGVQLVRLRDPRDGNDHEVRLADFVSSVGAAIGRVPGGALIDTRVGEWTQAYHFVGGG